MLKIKSYIVFCTLLLSVVGFSQEQIVGKVINERNQPIENAKVFFGEYKNSVLSDKNGVFSITNVDGETLLYAEATNYDFKIIDLQQQEDLSHLIVTLEEAELLSELVIVTKPTKRLKKKENPAYTLLKKVWKNEYRVGQRNFDYYQYNKAEYVKIGMNNVDAQSSAYLLNQEKEKVIQRLRGKDDNNLRLPLFLSTRHQTIFGKNKGGSKEIALLNDESTTGVIEDGFAFDRLMSSMKTFNVYNNTFIIGNKPFTSPIASYGYSSYLYQLTDTIDYKNKRYFRVHFFPRYDEDLALQGDFLVRDSIYVLQSIRLYNTKKTNVNFIRDIFIEKEYEIFDDSYSMIKKDHYFTDYTFGETDSNATGVFLEYNIDYSDFLMNKAKPAKFYRKIGKEYRENVQLLEETIFDENSDSELSEDKLVIGEVRDNPKVKELVGIFDFLASGYIPVGHCIELGSIWDLFGRSDAEGFRTRWGMRTYCSTQDRFRVYAYGAYGFKDKRFKYGVSAQYLINQSPRILLGGIHLNDNEIPATTQDIPNLSQFTMTTKYITFFTRGKNYNITRNRSWKGLVDITLQENLQLNVSGKYQTIESALPKRFDIGFEDNGSVQHEVKDFEVNVNLQYTPGRNVYGKGVEQRFGKNLFPTYAISFSKSIPNVAGSMTDFYKMQAMINYPLSVYNIGMLDISFTAGKTIGEVPLVLTPSTAANQTYSYVPRTFSLLDTYDFVTDSYVNMFLEHHFNGFIFNKIPLTRKYKLRAVIFANAAYGTISEASKRINRSSIRYQAPDQQLYWEYGFGIENIGGGNIRPLRIDAVFRNKYGGLEGKNNPMWGIRVKVFPEF